MKKSIYETEKVNCNLCNELNHRIVHDMGGLNIVKCRNCGLMYTNPRLTREALSDLYNKEYFANPAFFDKAGENFFGYSDYESDKPDIQASFRKSFKIIDRFKKTKQLLEVGSAYGFFLELAKKRGWTVHGFELSQKAALYSTVKLGLKNTANREFRGNEFADSHFDVVTLFDVIEHMRNPMTELKKYNKVLRPGGLLALSTINVDSPVAKLLGKKWEDIRRNKVHLYIFSKRTITKMLKQSGFEVFKIEQYGRYFSLNAIADRLSVYGKKRSRVAKSVFNLLRLGHLKFYVIPFTKIMVYARKVK